MRLSEFKEYLHCYNFHVPTPEEIESLHYFDDLFIEDGNKEIDEEYLKQLATELEEEKEKARILADKIQKATSGRNTQGLTDAVYVVLANAQTEQDYLRLIARYGYPTYRDIDKPLQEYEALCEAVYRVCAVLAYANSFGEYNDVQKVFSINNMSKHMDEPHARYSTQFSLLIPDYRRAIYPNEITLNDANDFLISHGRCPVPNPVHSHRYKTPNGYWFIRNIYSKNVQNGLIEYNATAYKDETSLNKECSNEDMRLLAFYFIHEVINEQIRDMEIFAYDGEFCLEDTYSGLEPPMWRLVWIALALAKGKEIPSICRTCGRIIDRRSERRCRTVSCNQGEHDCCSAFHNNGNIRMSKRELWGRSFKPNSTFSYIDEYRASVKAELSEPYFPVSAYT